MKRLTDYLNNAGTCPTLLLPLAYVRNLLILSEEGSRRNELRKRGLEGEADIESQREINAEFDNWMIKNKLMDYLDPISSVFR